jgi:5-methylthioribose kinase
VSSDIVHVRVGDRDLCVKRALARLKVSADWHVPVSRSASEARWLEVAGNLRPGRVPRLLGWDAAGGAIVMQWLDPAAHPVWKARLRDGDCAPAFAAQVGALLAGLHADTAQRDDLARDFDTGELFHALRLEPYLLATARAHPALAPTLRALAETTARRQLALVHGDASPKNLLVAPDGPVLLDAECAWYGDPAFDAAFCLNHLLLKAAWRPGHRDGYRACFEAMVDAYLAGVRWEPVAGIAARVAALLPALMLARIDGKSPVEYLDEAARAGVRAFAVERLGCPVDDARRIADDWYARIDPDDGVRR